MSRLRITVAALSLALSAMAHQAYAGVEDKDVARMIRTHMEGIVAWAQTRQTNGFLEAINGLFQAAKRRARGFTRLSTIKTVIFLIAGKLDLQAINPHAGAPT